MLKEALKEGLDLDKTGVFYCLGNHDTDPSQLGVEVMSGMPALFRSQLGDEFFRIDSSDSSPELGRRHAVVNGYHFISVVHVVHPCGIFDASAVECGADSVLTDLDFVLQNVVDMSAEIDYLRIGSEYFFQIGIVPARRA